MSNEVLSLENVLNIYGTRKNLVNSQDCLYSYLMYGRRRCQYCRFGIQPYFGLLECQMYDIREGME